MFGMCALNNATGGQQFQLDDMLQPVQHVLVKESDHCSPSGDFREEALACALRRDDNDNDTQRSPSNNR